MLEWYGSKNWIYCKVLYSRVQSFQWQARAQEFICEWLITRPAIDIIPFDCDIRNVPNVWVHCWVISQSTWETLFQNGNFDIDCQWAHICLTLLTVASHLFARRRASLLPSPKYCMFIINFAEKLEPRQYFQFIKALHMLEFKALYFQLEVFGC